MVARCTDAAHHLNGGMSDDGKLGMWWRAYDSWVRAMHHVRMVRIIFRGHHNTLVKASTMGSYSV